jgi:ribosome-binding protein aMBF1 (putative translation factor)
VASPGRESPKSEGQRRLHALGLSLDEIAKAVGTTTGPVSRWLTGQRTPDDTRRRAVESAYGIPATSWDHAPGWVESDAPTVSEQARADLDEIEQVEEVLGSVRSKRRSAGITTQELARLAASEGQLIERLARLKQRQRESKQLLEATIVYAHPAWHRIREAISAALKKHPSVAREVDEALAKLGAA